MKRDTVSIELNGGLGNQLFQLAAINCYALKHSRSAEVNINRFQHRSASRKFSLDKIFCQELFYPVRINFKKEKVPNFAKRFQWVLGSIYQKFRQPALRKSNTVGYNQNLIRNPNLSNLNGYHQTHRYVDELNWKILFQKAARGKDDLLALINLMEQFNPVLLHIRGGDYLIDRSGIGNLSSDYFLNALKEVSIGGEQVWVFSDDSQHAKATLEILPYDLRFVSEEFNLTPIDSILLISQGKRIVISNSTFAWWGAYLSEDAKICAPKKWFRNLEDPFEILPKSWIRVESKWLDL